ncbi:MAG: VWA domain-containing protein, partial [Betaproteobacteria bacterium]|nr:VWA domain-containing protein [Betaproteobacteria bacterium]
MSVIKRSHWIIAVALLLSVIACTTTERQTSSGDVTRVDTEHKAESDQMTMPAEKARRTEEAAAATTSMNAKRIHALPATAPQFHADREISLRQNTEKYQHVEPHPIKLVMEQPVSTFSIDVDTGAYANVRRFLNAGQLPPSDAVRVEEMINYFPYSIEGPIADGEPFAVHVEVAPTPWNADTHLMRVALKGREVAKAQLPPANLVFLIDVSGSMEDANKLPLLKQAFRALTRHLRPTDRVSLVVYAGASGVVLEPTAGSEQRQILAALDRLQAGGSTHGAAGIELAYQVARQAFIPGGINRVLLATDGDFNVGITNFEHLKNLIERQRASGVALSTLGFGTGNYNDHLMEQLADAGNGNYSYIDTANEARKVLIDEFSST